MNGGELNAKTFVVYVNANGNVILNGGSIHATNGYGIRLAANAEFMMNDGKVIIDSQYAGLLLSQAGAAATINGGHISALAAKSGSYSGNGIQLFKDTSLTVNGGTIEAYGNAILGNGTNDGGNNDGSNAKITVTGGTISSVAGLGIYTPQVNGQTLITGGTISGTSAVEIRAGTLKLTGGNFYGTEDKFEVASNANGGTTNGSDISVAPHTTDQPITVEICGGTYRANRPISISNPLDRPDDVVAQIQISINDKCGDVPTFEASGDFDLADAIDLDEPFIRGGLFTYDVIDYVPVDEGYTTIEQPDDIFLVTRIAFTGIDFKHILDASPAVDLTGILYTAQVEPAALSAEQASSGYYREVPPAVADALASPVSFDPDADTPDIASDDYTKIFSEGKSRSLEQVFGPPSAFGSAGIYILEISEDTSGGTSADTSKW